MSLTHPSLLTCPFCILFVRCHLDCENFTKISLKFPEFSSPHTRTHTASVQPNCVVPGFRSLNPGPRMQGSAQAVNLSFEVNQKEDKLGAWKIFLFLAQQT